MAFNQANFQKGYPVGKIKLSKIKYDFIICKTFQKSKNQNMKPDFKFTDTQTSTLSLDQQKSIQNKHKLIREFAKLCQESTKIEKELSQINTAKSSKNLENKSTLYQKLTEINVKLAQIRQEMNNCNQEIKGENKHQTIRQTTSQIYNQVIEHHQKEFGKLGEYIQLAEDFVELKGVIGSSIERLVSQPTGLVQLDKLILSLNNINPNRLEIPSEPLPILNISEINVIDNFLFYQFLGEESLTEINNRTIYNNQEHEAFLQIKSIFEAFGFEEELTGEEIEEVFKKVDATKLRREVWNRGSIKNNKEKRNEALQITKQEKWQRNIKETLEEFLRRKTQKTAFNSYNYEILRELNGRKSINREPSFGQVYQQMKKEKPQAIQELEKEKSSDTAEIIKMWTEPVEAKILMTQSSKPSLRVQIYADLTQEKDLLTNKSIFRNLKENDKFMALLKKLGKKQKLFQTDDQNDKISYYNDLHSKFLTEQINIFENKITKLEQEKENKIKLMEINNVFSKSRIPEKTAEIDQDYQSKFQELKTDLGNLRDFLGLLQNWRKDRQNDTPTEYTKFAEIESICNQLLGKIPLNKVQEVFDKLTTIHTTIDLDKEIWGQDSLESAQITHTEQNTHLKITIGELLTKINENLI